MRCINILVLLLSSCATQPLYIKSESPGAAATLVRHQNFYFMGLGQEKPFDAKQLCADLSKEVHRMDIGQTASDVGWSWLTLGVYTPRTIKIYCR